MALDPALRRRGRGRRSRVLARTTQGVDPLKTGLLRLGQLALTVLVTWFILDRVGLGLSELQDADIGGWRPNAFLFASSCLALAAGYAMSAGIWARIVEDMGGPSIPVRRSVPLFMIANLGRYVPGKVWQIAGLAVLAKGEGVSAHTATAAAVLGQGIALIAATGVGIGALLTAPDGYYRAIGLGTAVAMAVGLVLIALPPTFQAGTRLWFRVARTEVPASLEAVHGLRWTLLYFVNWVVYALSFWLFVASFDRSAALIPVATAFAAAYVLGYVVIIAPAGAGIREGALVVFLSPHLGVGPAGGIAILARLWTTVVEVVPAGLFWMRRVATTGVGEGTAHE